MIILGYKYYFQLVFCFKNTIGITIKITIKYVLCFIYRTYHVRFLLFLSTTTLGVKREGYSNLNKFQLMTKVLQTIFDKEIK